MTRWGLPLACGLLQGLTLSAGAAADVPPVAATAASLVGLVSGLALVARRQAALLVLAVAGAAQVVQVLLGRPSLPVVTAVAAYAVARHVLLDPAAGRRALAGLAAAVVAVAGAVALSGRPGTSAPYALCLVLAVLLGLGLSLRALRSAAAHRELVMGERLRIARDLHDVVGHGVGAMMVQAGAARLAVAAGATGEATRALLAVEAAGRSVLRETRWLVGLLRDDADRPGLGDLEDLVGSARRSGLDVALSVRGDPAAVSDEVGEAAYRVVQESLTNVLRHGDDPAAEVRVRVADQLDVEVTDRGTSCSGTSADGHGLQGMRERVAALGGALTAGPDAGVGWSVHARIPVRARG